MSTKVWLSSLEKAVDPADATISVFDRGFLFGDSVYETMRTVKGRAVDWERHIVRLRASAKGIGLEIPFSDDDLLDATRKTLLATGDPESRIRMMVTRGTGPISLDLRTSTSPLLVIVAEPLVLPKDEDVERGVSAVIVDLTKGFVDPSLKTGNYLPNILALRQAIQRSGDEAIMCNAEGAVAEGATSNVFMVSVIDGASVLSTPSLASGVLEGITRRKVIELAKDLGIPLQERTIWPDELRAASEIFLTSSVRGIMPVTKIDHERVGAGRPGSITSSLIGAYRAFLETVALSS